MPLFLSGCCTETVSVEGRQLRANIKREGDMYVPDCVDAGKQLAALVSQRLGHLGLWHAGDP